MQITGCDTSILLNILFISIFIGLRYLENRNKKQKEQPIEVTIAIDEEGNELKYKGNRKKYQKYINKKK